jgi:hypothetical protein
MKLRREAKADQAVISIKSLEAVAKMANGTATKIIVPSNLQDVASIATTVGEMLKEDKKQ